MTIKAWNKFLVWAKTEKKPIDGYITLYPESLKFISNPTYYQTDSSEKGRDIFFSIGKGNIRISSDDLYLIAKQMKFDGTPDNCKLSIPFKYIKRIRFYNYNY